ncbi:MAG: putative DNA-binding domain-containing protein [Hyphomicrobiales bacterium]|nr:putative DNA-binding domain-containing protein [Hyphomicrobiales bacterium]
MPSLADRLSGFADALFDPTLAVPPGLVGPDGEPSPRRFAVYRNNVVVGLVEALKANHPAVCRIVGEEFFDAMARAFVVSGPSASPILLDYGAGFADFIAEFQPVADVPYLADVARIERAWTEAYHAPEAIAMTPEALAAIPEDQIAGLTFSLHPSLRMVWSRFPALTIWRMNIGDGIPAPVDLTAGGEDALLIRPAADVEIRAMPPGGYEFVEALKQRQSLTGAMRTALGADPRFDLSGNLRELIAAGAVINCHPANEPGLLTRGVGA